MSELKAKRIVDVYDEYSANPYKEAQVYLKSEADKVIAELEKKLDIYKRGWMENDRVNANQYAEIRHHKYKRCMAKAMWCDAERDIFNLTPKVTKVEFFARWHKRWLEIATKFKEAK